MRRPPSHNIPFVRGFGQLVRSYVALHQIGDSAQPTCTDRDGLDDISGLPAGAHSGIETPGVVFLL